MIVLSYDLGFLNDFRFLASVRLRNSWRRLSLILFSLEVRNRPVRMDLLHVLDKVASFCVSLGTPLLLAREGFDGCMLLQMDTVSVRPHERFSAELTLVRPLSGVQTSMLD